MAGKGRQQAENGKRMKTEAMGQARLIYNKITWDAC